jgi:hypothetical protein
MFTPQERSDIRGFCVLRQGSLRNTGPHQRPLPPALAARAVTCAKKLTSGRGRSASADLRAALPVTADDASDHQPDQEQQDQDHDGPLQLAQVRELHVVQSDSCRYRQDPRAVGTPILSRIAPSSGVIPEHLSKRASPPLEESVRMLGRGPCAKQGLCEERGSSARSRGSSARSRWPAPPAVARVRSIPRRSGGVHLGTRSAGDGFETR